MKKEKKVYLAGPDVFAPNKEEIGEMKKNICKENNLIGLYPLDIEINQESENIKHEIVKACISMVDDTDYVLANLSNFRGTNEHPSCDSGTAWECGYALATGKKVYGYTNDLNSVPNVMKNSINLVFNDTFENSIKKIQSDKLNENYSIEENNFKCDTISVDAESSDIKDCSANAAFILGYRFGKGLPCNAVISDNRSEVEKYGNLDKNGYKVDNYNEAVNIMIACTSNVIEKK